jgi:hypothetical protein
VRHIEAFDGPRPWQGKALSLNFPLESKATCLWSVPESQSVTIAAQQNGPLPPKLEKTVDCSPITPLVAALIVDYDR